MACSHKHRRLRKAVLPAAFGFMYIDTALNIYLGSWEEGMYMGLKHRNRSGYYLLYLFMTGLLLGILFVNFRHDIWMQEDGLLNASMMKQLQTMQFDGNYLFGCIVKHRIASVLIISMLASTMIGLPIVCGYVCYLGVGAGCLLSVAVIRYGIRGLFFIAAGMFPQSLLLIPGYFLIFGWGMDCNRGLYGKTDVLEGRYPPGRQFLFKMGLKLLGILLILLAGCAVESYVNPKIIHFILKIL